MNYLIIGYSLSLFQPNTVYNMSGLYCCFSTYPVPTSFLSSKGHQLAQTFHLLSEKFDRNVREKKIGRKEKDYYRTQRLTITIRHSLRKDFLFYLPIKVMTIKGEVGFTGKFGSEDNAVRYTLVRLHVCILATSHHFIHLKRTKEEIRICL
jgi:hypothetical protein